LGQVDLHSGPTQQSATQECLDNASDPACGLCLQALDPDQTRYCLGKFFFGHSKLVLRQMEPREADLLGGGLLSPPILVFGGDTKPPAPIALSCAGTGRFALPRRLRSESLTEWPSGFSP
jgi:hypothetical protein